MTRESVIFRNAAAVKLCDVPELPVDKWRSFVVDSCSDSQARVVSIFGVKSSDGSVLTKLFAVLGVDHRGELHVSSCQVDGSYPAISSELDEASVFEREIFENFGVEPVGHPDLKPVRRREGLSYFSTEGAAVHAVAVGPVHAGVIEPGHFRFQCHGEKILNLEISLGYQHRGVEKMMIEAEGAKRLVLAESIAGDTTVANALAYCHAVEGLAHREITQRARIIRGIALEMERVANHVGDLGAIANDVGFLPAASYLGRLRAVFLNVLLRICGNRFGRGLIAQGGVKYDVNHDMAAELSSLIRDAFEDFEDVWELMLHSSGLVGRLENTGFLSTAEAHRMGLVGVAARACNLQRDVRANYPVGIYRFVKIVPVRGTTGDVMARARVRALEIKKSIGLVQSLLGQLPIEKLSLECKELQPESMAISLVEGWRGELVHVAATDSFGKLNYYKVVDPSFHNWSALEVAMRHEQISNFPLCNKSFNLSYAGFDL